MSRPERRLSAGKRQGINLSLDGAISIREDLSYSMAFPASHELEFSMRSSGGLHRRSEALLALSTTDSVVATDHCVTKLSWSR